MSGGDLCPSLAEVGKYTVCPPRTLSPLSMVQLGHGGAWVPESLCGGESCGREAAERLAFGILGVFVQQPVLTIQRNTVGLL